MAIKEEIKKVILADECPLCNGKLTIEEETHVYVVKEYCHCEDCGFFFPEVFKREKPSFLSEEEFDIQSWIDSYLKKLNAKVTAGKDAQAKLDLIKL